MCVPRGFWSWWAVCLALVLGLASVAGRAGEPLAVLPDAAAVAAYQAAALKSGKVYACDLAKGESGPLYKASAADLPAGRYRLHALVAAAPLGHLAVGMVRLTAQAGEASRETSAIIFPAADEFVELTLDCTSSGTGALPVSLTWAASENQKTKGLKGRRALAIAQAAGSGTAAPGNGGIKDLGEAGEDLKLDDDGALQPLDAARKLPFHLLATGVCLERLSPLQVSVRTDKVVYRPGEPAAVTITVTNTGRTPAAATVTLDLLAGLHAPQPLGQPTITVAPGKSASMTVSPAFDTKGLYWGAEVRATAMLAGAPPAEARSVFAVASNPWEVAAITAPPQHLGAFNDPAKAAAAAAKMREDGFTGFEAFFWAPCDMLQFDPPQEVFFSGQTAYPGSRTGTKNLLDACHAQGLIGTVYANLWGGDGPPGLEVQRRHPDWFGGANYNTEMLENWDLLGNAESAMEGQYPATLGGGKIRAPGISTWCYNQLSLLAPTAVFRYHAAQLVASHQAFGWDGVRYDSYYSRYWSVRAMRLIQADVEQGAPGFQFGFNSFALQDQKALALDDMIGRGGMVMGEGIRLERGRHLVNFAREMLAWRDCIWAYGGHGPGMLFRAGTDDEEMTALGIEYEASLILACGGHFYYDLPKTDLGAYLPSALRYSEFVYDNKLRALRDPAAVVSFGAPVKLVEWPELLRTRDLADQQHRLVLHLVPSPADNNPFTDKTLKPPDVVRALPVTFHLPAGAKVTGAWWLRAAPGPRHEPLAVTMAGNDATVTLPELRFWNAVVLEFESTQSLATRVTSKDKTDTYIQDWYVTGPFPNTVKMEAVAQAFPPESGVDLQASYPRADGPALTWRRTAKPGAPPLGRLPLDFRDALNLHDNAPGCAYAYTEITSDTARQVTVCAKADDTLSLWVNGQPATFTGGQGELQDTDEGTAVITLKAGKNTLLAKVCEKWLYWLLALRLANADGTPLTGGVTIGLGGN